MKDRSDNPHPSNEDRSETNLNKGRERPSKTTTRWETHVSTEYTDSVLTTDRSKRHK